MGVVLFSVLSCSDKVNNKNSLLNNSQYSSLVDLVNPLMGTDSKFSLSNGNTYPAIATPLGMNFWTPQTAKMGDGWAYKYDDETIRGIKPRCPFIFLIFKFTCNTHKRERCIII